MCLDDGLQSIDRAIGEVVAQIFGHRRRECVRDLQVMVSGIAGIGRVDPDDEHGRDRSERPAPEAGLRGYASLISRRSLYAAAYQPWTAQVRFMRQPDLPTPTTGLSFTATVADDPAGGRRFRIDGADPVTAVPLVRTYTLAARGQGDYLDLFVAIARDFGTRMPRNRIAGAPSSFSAPYRPLLTRNLSPGIAYGYGDPAVLHVTPEQAGEARPGYYLVATSNDAPDSFPILWSADLAAWEHLGFAFPQGRKPPWCLDGAGVSDFWAPEMRHVGGEFLLCFTAREANRSLAIGMARSARPDGPFTGDAEPLLRGEVIDAHVFVDVDGGAMLFWKRDSNGLWPGLLAELLACDGALAAALFASAEDRRTATLLAALWSAAPPGEPMEAFFLLQPLVEAVVARFGEVRAELERRGHTAIVAAMTTAIHAQRLASDGRSLIGAPAIVLTNDLPWEGHLIEGPWLSAADGRYYLF